jgi:hypothetical protein
LGITLKYLKNNKAAGADSIAAQLLKNGRPNLVDALHAVVRQAWTGETLPNEQKTNYMTAARNDRTICDVGQSVAIGDTHFEFEVVKEFVYLGSLMTPTNDVSLEIQRRIQAANRCFLGLQKHLRSSHLSRQTKFTIHKTLIRLVLLYGSETWVLTKKEENQLLVFERKVLRTICGPKIENGVYRRRYNHELDNELDSPNALNVTKTSRLRYAGHMIRRFENLPQRARFRAKPNGRNPGGRMGWTAIAWP